MATLNRVCVICNSKYSYCPTCTKDNDKPTWMTTFCSENCHSLYEVLHNYYCGKINKNEALRILKTLDLSKVDELREGTRKVFDEVMGEVNIQEAVSQEVIADNVISKGETVEVVESINEVEEVKLENNKDTVMETDAVEIEIEKVIKEDIVKPKRKKVKCVE